MAETKKEKGRKLQVVKRDNEVSVFIEQAIAAALPIETMEKLFALKERYDAKIAKEAFVQSMAGFQSACPIIKKTKSVMNKGGATVRYKYAPLDTIVSTVKKILGEYGLSYTITVENDDKKVKAICRVTQIMGHSEESSFEVPIDSDAYMSKPQMYASALTFAKRYAFCNAFGILTGDEDNDAKVEQSDNSKKSPNKSKPQTTAQKFDEAKKMIATMGKDDLERAQKNIDSSNLYSVRQKSELIDALMIRSEQLEK